MAPKPTAETVPFRQARRRIAETPEATNPDAELLSAKAS
jgi:hypothetical protein